MCCQITRVLKKRLFSSIFEMNGTLIDVVNQYNVEKRLKSLNDKTLAQYVKETKNISIYNVSLSKTKYE